MLAGEKIPTTVTPRLEFVDSIRALAALYVVCLHSLIYLQPGWTFPVFNFFRYGQYAVDVFIVISGFCLMLPVVRDGGILRDSYRRFMLRRAVRILPPYYISLALCLGFLMTTASIGYSSFTKTGVLAYALVLQDVWSKRVGGEFNPVYWSIAIEFHIYFLFPFFVFAWRKFGIFKVTTIVSVLFISAAFVVRDHWLRFLYLQYVALFCFGAVAAWISFSKIARAERLRQNLPWLWIAGLLATGCIVIAATLDLKEWARNWAVIDPICGLSVLAALVFISNHRTHGLHRILTLRPLVWIGGFSYSLYLIHAPLFQLLTYGLKGQSVRGSLNLFQLILEQIVVLGVAWIFYLSIERPSMRWRPKKIGSVPSFSESNLSLRDVPLTEVASGES